MNLAVARRLPWLTYILAAAAAVGLKAHYSRATVPDLDWILRPTATVVGWVRHQVLWRDAARGWVADDGSFVIAPACAGINFLIVVFALAVFGFIHRRRTPWQRCGWFVLAACTAYLLTLAVNSVRITTAVMLYQAEVSAGWFTPERVHRFAGTIIYLTGLWAAWMMFDRLSARRAGDPQAFSWPPATVPAAYLALTVLVPLLHGAWRNFSAGYVEHAVTVSVLAASSLPLLSLLRWATSGRATEAGANGQTDDSGGRR